MTQEGDPLVLPSCVPFDDSYSLDGPNLGATLK